MSKNAKAPATDPHFLPVNDNKLIGQVPNDRLRHCQPYRIVRHGKFDPKSYTPAANRTIGACAISNPAILILQPVAKPISQGRHDMTEIGIGIVAGGYMGEADAVAMSAVGAAAKDQVIIEAHVSGRYGGQPDDRHRPHVFYRKIMDQRR